jgi:acyl CoA:acetate/3-ketoacid CoA transferase alpha subunit
MTDKQVDLVDAVRSAVADGDQVHFAFTHNRAHAAAYELARFMQGRRSLRLVGTGMLDYAIVLASAGVLRETEAAFSGATYPAPSPSRSAREMASYPGSDPSWTNLTMTLRLMAGALDLPAIPTRSLVGTGLADGPHRASVGNPFGAGTINLLAPIRPDVAFVHVPVADTSGNALVQGPYGEELWGAWGAERVVVTAERVVSPVELRKLGPGPGLPADRVDAVVEVAYGAHPQGQYVWDRRMPVIPYAEDYEFRRALRRADKTGPTMREWLDHWVLDTDHAGYLDLLGPKRLRHLEEQASGAWRSDASVADQPPQPTAQEIAAAVAMRSIADRLRGRASSTLVAGIGVSHLAAWAAARRLEGPEAPQLVAETGMSGLAPVAGDPYLFNFPNARSAMIHDGFLRMLGAVGTRADRAAMAVIAAGQVDKSGAINSTIGSAGEFIVGSGGANDLASSSAEVLVVMPMTRDRTPERVDFVTTRPRNMVGLATDVGLLEPIDGELVLTQVVAEPGCEFDQVARARAACGWAMRTASTVHRLDPPSTTELALLRSFDPARDLLG